MTDNPTLQSEKLEPAAPKCRFCATVLVLSRELAEYLFCPNDDCDVARMLVHRAQEGKPRAPVVAPQGDALQVLTDLRGHFGPSNCWCDAEGDAPHLYCCMAARELVEQLSASSPASSPVPPEQARICVKCKHQDRTDSRGHCIAVYRDTGGSLVYCNCVCEFPAAATPTPVEQERSPEEVAHEDSYWDDPLRGTNKC